MGELIELSHKGDLNISWDAENASEVETAKKIFDEKTKNRWSAFKDRGKGTRGDKITVFDRYAERIVLVPPISGG